MGSVNQTVEVLIWLYRSAVWFAMVAPRIPAERTQMHDWEQDYDKGLPRDNDAGDRRALPI